MKKKSPTQSVLQSQLPERSHGGDGSGSLASGMLLCLALLTMGNAFPHFSSKKKGWKTILSTANIEMPC